jgi:hypothetical protein
MKHLIVILCLTGFCEVLAAIPDSTISSNADTSNSEIIDTCLTASDSAWIDQVLNGTGNNSLIEISEIRVLGVNERILPFIKNLLPVTAGQLIEEKKLERILTRHNQQMAGRTDLFNSYIAMAGISRAGQNKRTIVVQAESRTFGSFDGGNAFVYFGNHNRTGRGDRWGAWVGYNKDGVLWDKYIGKGWYAGGKALFQFSTEDGSIDRKIMQISAGPFIRKMISPIFDLLLETGVWGSTDSTGKKMGEGTVPFTLFFQPSINIDYSWARMRYGIGTQSEVKVIEGIQTGDGSSFQGFSVKGLSRTKDYGIFNTVVFYNADGVYNRPDFYPSISQALLMTRVQKDDHNISFALSMNVQERICFVRHQLGFTRLDAGMHGFGEGLMTRGDKLFKGVSWGGGCFAGFSPPVGVDFNFDFGFDIKGYLGFRLFSAAYF